MIARTSASWRPTVSRVDGRPVDRAGRGAPPGDRSGPVQPAGGRPAPRGPVRRKLAQRPPTRPRRPAANGARAGGLRPGLDTRSNRPAVCGRRGDPEPRARRVLRRSIDRTQRSLAGHGTRGVPFRTGSTTLRPPAASSSATRSRDSMESSTAGSSCPATHGNSARTSTTSLRTRQNGERAPSGRVRRCWRATRSSSGHARSSTPSTPCCRSDRRRSEMAAGCPPLATAEIGRPAGMPGDLWVRCRPRPPPAHAGPCQQESLSTHDLSSKAGCQTLPQPVGLRGPAHLPHHPRLRAGHRLRAADPRRRGQLYVVRLAPRTDRQRRRPVDHQGSARRSPEDRGLEAPGAGAAHRQPGGQRPAHGRPGGAGSADPRQPGPADPEPGARAHHRQPHPGEPRDRGGCLGQRRRHRREAGRGGDDPGRAPPVGHRGRAGSERRRARADAGPDRRGTDEGE